MASRSCKATLTQFPLSSGLQHHHQAHQKNLPTNRTSRSDFTGLLLNVFSTGLSFSWLQAQTLGVLLSCKNPQGLLQAPAAQQASCTPTAACSDSPESVFLFPRFCKSLHSPYCCIYCFFCQQSTATFTLLCLNYQLRLKAHEAEQDATTHTLSALFTAMTSALEGLYFK